MAGLDDRTKLDITKLHSEINQFRNQEFWVCSFAIGLFGATAKELSNRPMLAFSVLLVLAGLFLWHYTLVATRTRLTTYLRVRRLSPWEEHYRLFANNIRRPSQRTAALVIFIALGILTPGIAAWDFLANAFRTNTLSLNDWCLWQYLLPFLAYIANVFLFGLRNYEDKMARYEQIWRAQNLPGAEVDISAPDHEN